MERGQIYDMMGEPELDYVSIFPLDGGGSHMDYVLPHKAENIANFIGQHMFDAEKIIVTDICDDLVCETGFGGFLLDCPDQKLCEELITHLVPMQTGEAIPKELPVATRAEFDALLREEDEAILMGELRMG